jgi:hypothetical protein
MQCAKPYYFTFLTSKCGVQHSNPAVVGRKSGLPKMRDDDICTITTSGQPLSDMGAQECHSYSSPEFS